VVLAVVVVADGGSVEVRRSRRAMSDWVRCEAVWGDGRCEWEGDEWEMEAMAARAKVMDVAAAVVR